MKLTLLNSARRKKYAVFAMILSAACWGFATVMTKGALSVVPPFTLLTIQLSASVVFLWLIILLTGKLIPANGISLKAASTGLLEPGLAYSFGVPGLALTSASNSSLIGSAEPAIIIFLAWVLFGERPQFRLMGAIIAALIGLALVTLSDKNGFEHGNLHGDILVLIGTAFAALYVVASSHFVANISPLSLAFVQQTAGLIVAFILLFLAISFGFESLPTDITTEVLLLALSSGIVQYALAFWLYLYGLKYLTVSVASLFLTLIPLFGVSGAIIFLGESLTSIQIIGAFFVITAIVFISYRPNNNFEQIDIQKIDAQ